MAADDGLKVPVVVSALGINAASLPAVFSQAYQYYVLSQSTDFVSVAGKANEAGQGAYDAQVKNDEQDVELADHEDRIAAAEAELGNHELRITAAEAKIINHEIRITTAESDIDSLEGRMTTAESDIDFLTSEVVDIEAELIGHESRISANEAELANHEGRIDALEYKTTRKKSEVVYSGVSLVIPTTGANLITLLKALTPTSGTLLPFFNTTTDKLTVYDENKTLDFKLSLIGSWPGGTANRSIQLTFSGAVPDTLVASRNVATVTDNVLLATFFSVDQGGFLATNGSTMTIQSNGSAFTATTIKIIAEQ
ncbi:tail needle knob protein [Buttiauxella sp.]|uniref:tail needle knob protein n=1 Tax=Buttiauxella sp. TaxID=1972222 RepID=UPI003C74006D